MVKGIIDNKAKCLKTQEPGSGLLEKSIKHRCDFKMAPKDTKVQIKMSSYSLGQLVVLILSF